MSVRRAQAEIDSAEFSEWRALYERVETFGEDRADLRAGIVASTIANFSGKVLKDHSSVSHEDYMPFRDKEEQKQSEADKVKAARMIALALGVVNKQK